MQQHGIMLRQVVLLDTVNQLVVGSIPAAGANFNVSC